MPVVVGSGNESPSQRGLAELSEEVAGYVLMPDSARARAVAAKGINGGIRRLNMRTWEWGKTYQDITLSAATADYDMASDFMAPRSTELLNGSGLTRDSGMTYMDPKSFVETFFDRTTSGTPCAYTVMNSHDTGQLTLDVPCSEAFVALYPTLRLRYYRRTAYLVSDSDILDAPSEVEEFIVWWGCAFVASRFDPSKQQWAIQNAMTAWNGLIRSEQRILTSDWSH